MKNGDPKQIDEITEESVIYKRSTLNVHSYSEWCIAQLSECMDMAKRRSGFTQFNQICKNCKTQNILI